MGWVCWSSCTQGGLRSPGSAGPHGPHFWMLLHFNISYARARGSMLVQGSVLWQLGAHWWDLPTDLAGAPAQTGLRFVTLLTLQCSTCACGSPGQAGSSLGLHSASGHSGGYGGAELRHMALTLQGDTEAPLRIPPELPHRHCPPPHAPTACGCNYASPCPDQAAWPLPGSHCPLLQILNPDLMSNYTEVSHAVLCLPGST